MNSRMNMSDTYQTVLCGTCKGGKQTWKLGGMFGDCNTCLGKGEIKQAIAAKVIPTLEPKKERKNKGDE